MQDKPQKEKWTTALDIANELGVNKVTINRIAKDNNLGTPQGATRTRFFTKKEVQRIKEICHIHRGNPTFSKKS